MRFLIFAAVLCLVRVAAAHDTWVETNVNLVRTGDAVHVNLMLGNHGNDHRDFKLAGKVDAESSTLEVIAPGGERYDLKQGLVDLGYAPGEGFWTTSFTGTQPGLYVVGHTFDKVMDYAPVRAVKSAKTLFVLSPSLDQVSEDQPGYDQPLGHALELVPLANPVTPMGPGTPIRVQVLFRREPLAGARVSFIPRGEELREGFDERFERQADAEGKASFTPMAANYYLVVVHRAEPEEKGPDYERTSYSATLTVYVPALCACCD